MDRPAPSAPPVSHGALPNLIVIGAAKCGTSALHRYLGAHPEIDTTETKEHQFFTRSDVRERLPSYMAKFDPGMPVRVDSSPAYAMWPFLPDVPERMAETLDEPRFVYIVGDPVPRIVAHWAEQYALLYERRRFHEAISDLDDPENPYMCASRYGTQLERYLRLFPRERILVLDQRDLRERRIETVRRLFEFAGVNPEFDSPEFDVEANTLDEKLRPNAFGRWLVRRELMGPTPKSVFPYRKLWFVVGRRVHRPQLDDRLRARLAEALRDDIERFRSLTDMPFRGWSV